MKALAKVGSKQWQKAQENKKRIYISAMQLFYEHGYDNVSVDDIVKHAKSSKGTFYNYFKSKDELFVYYNQRLDEHSMLFFGKLLNNKHYTGKNALDKMYIMIMYLFHTLAESGREFTSISDMRQLREDGGDAIDEDILCNVLLNVLPQLIEMGKRDGSVDENVDSESTQLLIYFMMKGIVYTWESGEGDVDLLKLAATSMTMLCSSIAAGK